jgi:hypothetical protein
MDLIAQLIFTLTSVRLHYCAQKNRDSMDVIEGRNAHKEIHCIIKTIIHRSDIHPVALAIWRSGVSSDGTSPVA